MLSKWRHKFAELHVQWNRAHSATTARWQSNTIFMSVVASLEMRCESCEIEKKEKNEGKREDDKDTERDEKTKEREKERWREKEREGREEREQRIGTEIGCSEMLIAQQPIVMCSNDCGTRRK